MRSRLLFLLPLLVADCVSVYSQTPSIEIQFYSDSCTEIVRRQISACAYTLDRAKLHRRAELLLLQLRYDETITYNSICTAYKEFAECSAGPIKSCLTSRLRFNHYILSASLWNSFCSQSVIDLNNAWQCLRYLDSQTLLDQCRQQTLNYTAPVLNHMETTEADVCDFMYSQLECVDSLSREHCTGVEFQNVFWHNVFDRTFDITRGVFIPECTFPLNVSMQEQVVVQKSSTWAKITIILLAALMIILVVAILALTLRVKWFRNTRTLRVTHPLQANRSKYIQQFDDGTLYI